MAVMDFIDMRSTNNSFNSNTQISQKGILGRLWQDLGLFILLIVGVGWVCTLVSHSLSDHAWSKSGNAMTIARPENWLGQIGAYVADVSYFLLGYTVWVLVFVLAFYWLQMFRAWAHGVAQPTDGRLLLARLWGRRTATIVGVLLLLTACAVLEWSRLYSLESQLPGKAGGILGMMAGPVLVRWLGDTGSTVFCLVLALLLFSLVLSFSWGRVAELTGAWVEKWFDRLRLWNEHRRDASAGRKAQREREAQTDIPETVRVRKAAFDAHDEPVSAVEQESYDQKIHRFAPEPETQWPEKVAAFAAPQPVKAPVQDLPWNTDPADAVDADRGRADPIWDDPLPSAPNETALVKTQPAVRPKTVFEHHPGGMLPSTGLLDPIKVKQETVTPETLEMTSRLIEKKLKDFGVQVRVVEALPGPVVTRYEIEPATGVKGSQIVNLSKDLARSLSLLSVRVVETIPGKNYMALELPNARRQTIQLREILSSPEYEDSKSMLTVGLGKDIVGESIVADLAKMPHCLVAGTTGSGKSVGINAMILSILYKAEPKDVRMLMIDPKMLEMAIYEGIPHLLCPVVTDMKQAAHGLNWCVAEMERRYKLMSKLGVRNLAGYNSKIKAAKEAGQNVGNPFSLTPESPEPLDEFPHIVIIIDELADLMMVVGKKIEELIARLAQKARAAGIHLILATQRPSVDVITGLIKANVPTRIAFQVSSKIDSRTILDQMGAEALLGMGDMLYMKGGTGQPVRVHGAFVSDEEVLRVVEYLKEQGGEPDYIEGVLEGVSSESESDWAVEFDGAAGGAGEKDPMYDQAVEIVIKDRKASISYVQRKLRIGYNRSARLLEDMEQAGLVSALTSSGQRDILVPSRGGD